MNRRLALATVLCALLAAGAGCAGFGGGAIDDDRLNQSAAYEWDTNATVTYNVTGEKYHAVVDVENGTEVPVYVNSQIEGERPVSIRALKFRYPNGTVTNATGSTVDVRNNGDRVKLTAQTSGKVAYTAPTEPKRFAAPSAVNGSYEVVLPGGMRVDAFLFGRVIPGGYSTTLNEETNRVTLRWAQRDGGTLSVKYYLERDVRIFVGLAGVLGLVAIVGVVYYRRQIRVLEAQREVVDEFET